MKVLNYLRGDGKIWVGLAVAALLLYLVAPALLTPFRLGLLGKYLCWAMVAVGIGLAWGKGGMLVLGQGVFFGLGGYIMAMHLKLTDAGPDKAPDFMVLYGNGIVPGWWEPFRSPVVALIVILLLPAAVAAVLGLAIFRRRVKGAYFAILSQALAAAFAILLIGQQTTTGGTNGLNGFRGFFGYNLYDPLNKQLLFFIAATVLLIMVVIAWHLYRSRFGELLVAVRDQEERVRFLGYNPANVKLVAYVRRRRHGRGGRSPLRADCRHHLPRRCRRGPFDRLHHRRRGRRAEHAGRPGARRRSWWRTRRPP